MDNGVVIGEHKEAPTVRDLLKSESEEMMREKDENEVGDVVTPWDVAASSKMGIDYDKLIGWYHFSADSVFKKCELLILKSEPSLTKGGSQCIGTKSFNLNSQLIFSDFSIIRLLLFGHSNFQQNSGVIE